MANIRFPTRVPASLSLTGVDTLPKDRPWLIKAGFDPTSPNLHLGHAVLFRALRSLQDQGHQVVLVVGDFTARIGDPTGRNSTRPVLTADQVRDNAKTYVEQATRILDASKTQVRHNSEWFETMSAADLLSLMQASTVAQMLARHDFSARMKANEAVGLHEMIYPLLQGHDSVVLKCDLEVGGQDQLFNLMAGRDAQIRAGITPQAVGVSPLLVGLDGERKMSKSYGNHISLTERPEEAYGKVMRITDGMVAQWGEALGIAPLLGGNPYDSKRSLARAITSLLHGPKAGLAAHEDWQVRFVNRAVPDDVEVRRAEKGWTIAQTLVEWGFVPSMTVAKRKIQEGAVRLDGQKVNDYRAVIPKEGVIQLGRRHMARIAPTPPNTPRGP